MEPLLPDGRYDADDPYGNIGGRQYPHTGSDWNGVNAGYPAKAIGTGVVVNKQWHDGNGNTVTVRLPDGHYYAYLHLQEPASVTVGQTVTIGQVIGKVGDTGYNSHGPHLHVTVTTGPQAYIGLPEQGRLDPWRFIQDHLNETDPSQGGIFMALTDAQQTELLTLARNIAGYVYAGGSSVASGVPGQDYALKTVMGRLNNLEAAVFTGGTSMLDGQKGISQSLAEIHTQVNKIP